MMDRPAAASKDRVFPSRVITFTFGMTFRSGFYSLGAVLTHHPGCRDSIQTAAASGGHNLDRQVGQRVKRIAESPRDRPDRTEGRNTGKQRFQHQLRLLPRHHLPQALMDAKAEPDMSAAR